ncbi:MAG: hypothetical protein QOH28_2911 [Actinomycetota bacterium]|nr:hypothetical protein [Actinomycetota bacterium]
MAEDDEVDLFTCMRAIRKCGQSCEMTTGREPDQADACRASFA